ncbi:BspA family leucine-rich repeat surface protein [Mycoplasma capricolum subsp. capricolum]|nr:BspA family leucine-rich repeat surface protein [Mycoplasma capricolum]MCK8461946.1 BspA family leucine-rich repeat surface protein [Mycoplasma capricolum subsp. capricolum]
MFKKAIYNKSKTQCLEIGYFTNDNDEIQIEQFKPTTKKVPSVLPKEITSLAQAFKGNENEFIDGIQYWDTSKVTNMAGMFSNAYTFNQPIGKWDTSKVKNMSGMFCFAESFNQDISMWNTSNIENMSHMFYYAKNFNQPIGNWNTSNVINMSRMFYEAKNFNQPIGNWNTSNVKYMDFMFRGAEKFNQPIGNWDTSNVTNMHDMFFGAYNFNQNISMWDVSKVTSMESMFDGAKSFDQNLKSWKVDSVTYNKNFSRGSGFFEQENKKPSWKIKEINEPIEKKIEKETPKEIIYKSPEKPKVNIPWTRIVTPATKISPTLKPTLDSKKDLEIPKANVTTTNQQSKKLSTPAIVGIVVGSQVVLTSLAVGTPYLIKRFKK